MIENKGNYKIQTPDTAGNYLWNGEEVFATEITLPNSAPLWQEVTEDFKNEWEEAHKEQEPEEVTDND
jgi:hypothetical protein